MNRAQIIELLNSLGAVLIPLNDKMPIPKAWQHLTESDPEALDPGSAKNVGVVLGNASGGLVDIDIDDKEALAFADLFLPEAGMEFGRKSKPRSHRIYRCQSAGKTKRLHGRNGVIVELRGNGGQTMFPPSVHPSGEHVEFSKADKPSEANWNDLEADIIELAIATEISQFYREGGRHEIAYALSGFLRRCNWPQERTEQFIEKLASAFGDNDVDDRVQAANDAYAAANPMGRSNLSDLTDDEFAASASKKWAGYHESVTHSQGGSLENEADCAHEIVTEHVDQVISDDLTRHTLTKNNLDMTNVYNTSLVNVETGNISFLLKELRDSYYELFHTETAEEFFDVGMRIDDIIDKLSKDCVIGSLHPVRNLLESVRSLTDDVYDGDIDQVWLIKFEVYLYLLGKQIEFLNI